MPWGGLDLIQTIDGQDVSNIGYFDKPGADLDNLPLRIRFNDLRARGKGVSLGEYGVKVHPAWSVENGAQNYHIARNSEQQIQLFMTVAHYGLGLGACKVQNWCLRDAQASVFPWGIFYPNQLIPKDVAYVHRNLSFVWRHFTPRYIPAKLTVCVPNQLRLGNYEAVGRGVAEHAFATLLGLHYDFNVIDDAHLERLPAATRVIIYPAPFAVADDAYARLVAWVKEGGTLLVTGDISYDEHRQRTRTGRLEELAGARFVAENYANIARPAATGKPATFTLPTLPPRSVQPCIKLRAVGAEVLGQTAGGDPVLVRNAVGRGHVYLFLDPIELAAGDQAAGTRRCLYRAFLQAATAAPLGVEPDEPWLHVMTQPTARGTVYVVVNCKQTAGREEVTLRTAAGPLTLATRNRWPALAAVTDAGKVVAVNAFGTAAIGASPVLRGTGLKAILALDGNDLRRSQAIVVAPFERGTLEIPARLGKYVAVVGEFRGGRWTPLEQIDLAEQPGSLAIDPDRATTLILLCEPGQQSRWAGQLTDTVLHPSRIHGY
ncbi:MAG: hypothetical protein BMS9Abin04_093 [Planctomycetia bacterium]|nr:MAG: hypothetical protein BMS9Abin04_093 [Planctomycetia bacterium]